MSEVCQAEFARAGGVSPAVISRKIKNNTLIKNSAGFLDTENPVNARYLARRRLKQNHEALKAAENNIETQKKKLDFTQFDNYAMMEDTGLPQKLLSMTIRELVVKFKGIDGIERYVRMLRDLSSAEEKTQKTQERRLQLVEKDFVVSHVFHYIDSLMTQLLEWPDSNADGLIALVLSKGEAARLEVVQKIEGGLSKIIANSKDYILKELSGLKVKYQRGDDIDEIKEAIEEAVERKEND